MLVNSTKSVPYCHWFQVEKRLKMFNIEFQEALNMAENPTFKELITKQKNNEMLNLHEADSL